MQNSHTHIISLEFNDQSCLKKRMNVYSHAYQDTNGHISIKEKIALVMYCVDECGCFNNEHMPLNSLFWRNYYFHDDCNSGKGVFKIKNNRLVFRGGLQTMMYCMRDGINKTDLDSLVKLAFQVVHRNNCFFVTNDSLKICDSLGYSLVFSICHK